MVICHSYVSLLEGIIDRVFWNDILPLSSIVIPTTISSSLIPTNCYCSFLLPSTGSINYINPSFWNLPINRKIPMFWPYAHDHFDHFQAGSTTVNQQPDQFGIISLDIHGVTLWLFNIAMENGQFIVDLPILMKRKDTSQLLANYGAIPWTPRGATPGRRA